MKLHQYENYDEYVKEQTQANVAKLKNVWVRENAIQKVEDQSQDLEAFLKVSRDYVESYL